MNDGPMITNPLHAKRAWEVIRTISERTTQHNNNRWNTCCGGIAVKNAIREAHGELGNLELDFRAEMLPEDALAALKEAGHNTEGSLPIRHAADALLGLRPHAHTLFHGAAQLDALRTEIERLYGPEANIPLIEITPAIKWADFRESDFAETGASRLRFIVETEKVEVEDGTLKRKNAVGISYRPSNPWGLSGPSGTVEELRSLLLKFPDHDFNGVIGSGENEKAWRVRVVGREVVHEVPELMWPEHKVQFLGKALDVMRARDVAEAEATGGTVEFVNTVEDVAASLYGSL